MYRHQSQKRDQLPSSVYNLQSSSGRVAILDTSFLQPFKIRAVQFRLLAYQSAFMKTHFAISANIISGWSLWLKQHYNHLIVTFPCIIQLESITVQTKNTSSLLVHSSVQGGYQIQVVSGNLPIHFCNAPVH